MPFSDRSYQRPTPSKPTISEPTLHICRLLLSLVPIMGISEMAQLIPTLLYFPTVGGEAMDHPPTAGEINLRDWLRLKNPPL